MVLVYDGKGLSAKCDCGALLRKDGTNDRLLCPNCGLPVSVAVAKEALRGNIAESQVFIRDLEGEEAARKEREDSGEKQTTEREDSGRGLGGLVRRRARVSADTPSPEPGVTVVRTKVS